MILRDKNHSCPSSVFWKHQDTGTLIYWTETKSWGTFYGEIVQFCERNRFPVPSDEEVQDIVCSQLGQGWCVGEPNFKQSSGRQECRTCGGR